MLISSLRIVRVLPEQLALLQQISRQTFFESYSHLNTEENMQHYLAHNLGLAQLTKEIQHPASQFYFARMGQTIVGYIKINFGEAQTELQDTEATELERIYVYKQYQGKGIGVQLLQKAIAIGQSRLKNYIWLGVWEKNPRAIQFYQKQGFVPFDTHQYIVGQDIQNDILMKMDL